MRATSSKKLKDFERYEKLKKSSTETCKTAYNDYITNIISPDSSSNPKRFYGFIKSKKIENHFVAHLKAKTGITHSDSATKANILNDQFSSVFNKGEDPSTIPDMGPSPHPTVDNITVTENGVHKLLAGLEPHKASGPDQLPARLASELAPIYTLLFQASLDQGIIPDEWKSANVVPIYKKGDRSKPENYRPVSLTSITCKTLEHIVSSTIMKHMDHHSILTDAQHGFGKRRSCETQLLRTIQDLASTIDVMGQTDVILLDFSKAFDKVPHLRLLSKIRYYGIQNNLNRWISSFLEGRNQQVLLDGSSSTSSPMESGVPQRSVIGPLLFLLYINDLPMYISPESVARLFADDCVFTAVLTLRKMPTICRKTLWPPEMGERLAHGISTAEVSDYAYHQQKEAQYSTKYHTWTCTRRSRHSKVYRGQHTQTTQLEPPYQLCHKESQQHTFVPPA